MKCNVRFVVNFGHCWKRDVKSCTIKYHCKFSLNRSSFIGKPLCSQRLKVLKTQTLPKGVPNIASSILLCSRIQPYATGCVACLVSSSCIAGPGLYSCAQGLKIHHLMYIIASIPPIYIQVLAVGSMFVT